MHTNACAPIATETLDQFHESVVRLSDTVGVGRIEPIIKKMSMVNAAPQNKKVIHRAANLEHQSDNALLENNPFQVHKRLYRSTKKPRAPRTWRTRIDPFESVTRELHLQLELDPARTATSLLDNLIKDHPDQFSMSNLRTLQSRTSQWRKEQIKINQERYSQNALTENNVINKYISLVAHSVIGG